MILSAYVARRFLRMFVMIAAIFAAILFLIDVVEQIRRFSDQDMGLIGAAGLSALNITASFYSILPLITVLAGIALFLGLSRSSERWRSAPRGGRGCGCWRRLPSPRRCWARLRSRS